MGQRFQIFAITSDNEGNSYTHGYHLQWSWGHYSISRLYQMLKFGEENCARVYSNLKGTYKRIVEVKTLIRSLVSLNIYNNSFVYAGDLEKDFDYTDKKLEGEYDSPFEFDNNDGVFVIDYRYKRPKFALFKSDYIDEKEHYGFIKVSALEYLNHYFDNDIKENFKNSVISDSDEEYEEIYNDYMEMVKYIDSFETLSEKDMDNIFKKIDKKYIDYSSFIDLSKINTESSIGNNNE
ncbi:hypothetical protein U729_3220 (plasmid) [Clostridium baratii str. Sullivan]|uniref:Uncharacterized protein n=1 Tax=Clostridium baratii str. Sullivan TaxID=1415775 RepID=A0A0A7G0C8_9CLOT|nr:hypothetical protein [Clostridium baratii]AIY85314.1 hypothetical protein U729_3220 [Clostridium baratii str. Sullivan]